MNKQLLLLFLYVTSPFIVTQPSYAMEQVCCTCVKNIFNDKGELAYESICSYCRGKASDSAQVHAERERLILHDDICTRQAKQWKAKSPKQEDRKYFENLDQIQRWQLIQSPNSRQEWQNLINSYGCKPDEQDTFLPQIVDFPKARLIFTDGIKELNEHEVDYFETLRANKNFQTLNGDTFIIPVISFIEDNVTIKLFDALLGCLKSEESLKSLNVNDLIKIIQLAEFLNLKTLNKFYKVAALKKLDAIFPQVANFKKNYIKLMQEVFNNNLGADPKNRIFSGDIYFFPEILERIKLHEKCKKITAVDVSHRNLEKLSLKALVTTFPNLQKIDFSNNKISRISLSDWQTLIQHPLELDLRNNHIKECEHGNKGAPEKCSIEISKNLLSDAELAKLQKVWHPNLSQKHGHKVFSAVAFAMCTLFFGCFVAKVYARNVEASKIIHQLPYPELQVMFDTGKLTMQDYVNERAAHGIEIISHIGNIVTFKRMLPQIGDYVASTLIASVLSSLSPVMFLWQETKFHPSLLKVSENQPTSLSAARIKRITNQWKQLNEQQKSQGLLDFNSFAVAKKQ